MPGQRSGFLLFLAISSSEPAQATAVGIINAAAAKSAAEHVTRNLDLNTIASSQFFKQQIRLFKKDIFACAEFGRYSRFQTFDMGNVPI
ncbi:hypothetical protein, partial [Telmatospirillum sp.]|uniref:hypothetical protein n=1 Tax=Telmatospirillum sp. TaxID=2079197 RepID=UPI002847916E